MKYLRQFLIILFVTCLGELLNYYLPLPIPASIYGLVLMLVLLMTGAVKLENVETAADVLVEIMPVMFIPAGVGLIVSWTDLRKVLVPVLIITVVVTFLVMIVTGKVSDAMLKGTDSENIIEIHDSEFRHHRRRNQSPGIRIRFVSEKKDEARNIQSPARLDHPGHSVSSHVSH